MRGASSFVLGGLAFLLCVAPWGSLGDPSTARFAATGQGFVARAGDLEVRADDRGTALVPRGAERDAVVLRTTDVGGLSVEASSPLLRAGGAVERRASAAWERVELRGVGVEQSWRFDEAVRGDLVVRVEAPGATLASVAADGLHLRRGGTGLVYGEATWVDARGAATSIAPRWDGGAIVLRVPAAIAARSAYPAVLDPFVSLEIAVDQPSPLPGGGATTPRIAASGSGYLAVWIDTVDDLDHVLAARLDSNGAMIDATPISVHTFDQSTSGTAVVASDGTDYFVAWLGSGSALQLVGTRVRASDGALLDAAPDPVVFANRAAGTPALTYVGGTYVLAFLVPQPTSGAWDVRTQRVRAGAPLDSLAGVTIGSYIGSPSLPAPAVDVAAGPDQAFVVWRGQGVRERVSNGAVLDAAPVTFAQLAAGRFPRAAFDGANYYVAWYDGKKTLWGARVRASDGVALDPDDTVHAVPGSKELRTTTETAQDMVRVVVADGTVAVAYAPLTEPTGATTVAAFAIDPGTGLPATAAPDPVLATKVGSEFDVAVGAASAELAFQYEEPNVPPSGAAGVHLTHAQGALTAAPGAPIVRLSLVSAHLFSPAIASNGTDYLVTWYNGREAGVYASRVRAATRTSLDPQGILLATGATPPRPWSLSSNGSEYLYATSSGTNVIARSVAADGTLGATITVRTWTAPGGSFGPEFVGVQYDGANYFLTWWEGQDLQATRLDGATHALLDATPVRIASANVVNPGWVATAVDKPGDPARTLLAAWNDALDVAGVGMETQMSAVRVRAATAASLDLAAPLALRVSATGGGDLRAASDGTKFVLVWSDFGGDAGPRASLYGSRFDPQSGALLDKTASADGVLLVEAPAELESLVWDGRSYVALWGRGSSAVTRFDLDAARFSAGLALLDPPASAPGFLLRTQAVNDGVAAATTGAGHVAAVYPVAATAPGELGQHIHARFIDDDGLPSDGGAVYEVADASAEGGASDAAGTNGVDDSGSDAAGANGVGDGGSDAAGTNAVDGGASDAAVDGATGPVPSRGSGGGGGCGCRAAGSPSAPGAIAAIALAAALWVRRRQAHASPRGSAGVRKRAAYKRNTSADRTGF